MQMKYGASLLLINFKNVSEAAPCIDSIALISETVLGYHSLLVHYQLN